MEFESKSRCKTECGHKGVETEQLDEKTAKRIEDHPCYSEKAHHDYARMHVPVAPACNIQCNYCNRKYDCANESRPGVTSGLWQPSEAAQKVSAIKAMMPELTVVGFAGPGDPLAKPDKIFETIERIQQDHDDLHMCVSTNGLTLVDHVARLKELGVDHVTVTINAIDEHVAEKIYPWVYFEKKKRTGIEASKVLLERQIEGVKELIAADILCKINSVLIPGVNKEHLVEVNDVVSSMGVFMHNIMPLVSKKQYGTVFALQGIKSPTKFELETVRSQCTGSVKLMRHCRQCRADAVGKLGRDVTIDWSELKNYSGAKKASLA